MPVVRIPTPLRKYTAGKEEVSAQGATIGALLAELEKNHPGIKERICDETGKVRRFVNIFVRDEDIRFLQNLDTPLDEKDEISIVPAIAGGIGVLRLRCASLSTAPHKFVDKRQMGGTSRKSHSACKKTARLAPLPRALPGGGGAAPSRTHPAKYSSDMPTYFREAVLSMSGGG